MMATQLLVVPKSIPITSPASAFELNAREMALLDEDRTVRRVANESIVSILFVYLRKYF